MKHSFEILVDLIGENNKLWVELITGVAICLVDVADYKNKIFIAKYTPCIPNTKSYSISYNKIKCISGGT